MFWLRVCIFLKIRIKIRVHANGTSHCNPHNQSFLLVFLKVQEKLKAYFFNLANWWSTHSQTQTPLWELTNQSHHCFHIHSHYRDNLISLFQFAGGKVWPFCWREEAAERAGRLLGHQANVGGKDLGGQIPLQTSVYWSMTARRHTLQGNLLVACVVVGCETSFLITAVKWKPADDSATKHAPIFICLWSRTIFDYIPHPLTGLAALKWPEASRINALRCLSTVATLSCHACPTGQGNQNRRQEKKGQPCFDVCGTGLHCKRRKRREIREKGRWRMATVIVFFPGPWQQRGRVVYPGRQQPATRQLAAVCPSGAFARAEELGSYPGTFPLGGR